jgi:adenylate kinase family enzyme
MERVVVIGCAGSGKSTLARQLAGRTGLPLVERDGLGEEGSAGYLSAIAEMAAQPRWILDGAPYYADELVYAAADTVIFLDYPKALVLCHWPASAMGSMAQLRPAVCAAGRGGPR